MRQKETDPGVEGWRVRETHAGGKEGWRVRDTCRGRGIEGERDTCRGRGWMVRGLEGKRHMQ